MPALRSFLFIPGAGGAAWYWHRVVAALDARGHEAVAVDLPDEDEGAGWQEYVEVAAAAMAGRGDLVVVGQSMGGFTHPCCLGFSQCRCWCW